MCLFCSKMKCIFINCVWKGCLVKTLQVCSEQTFIHCHFPSSEKRAKCIFCLSQTICYCWNHFKVAYAISHHSKREWGPQCTHRCSCVNWKATWKDDCVDANGYGTTFKAMKSISFLVRNFISSLRQPPVLDVVLLTFVLHSHLFKYARFSLKCLNLNCSLQVFCYVEALLPHPFHDRPYSVGPAHPNASCMHFHLNWQTAVSLGEIHDFMSDAFCFSKHNITAKITEKSFQFLPSILHSYYSPMPIGLLCNNIVLNNWSLWKLIHNQAGHPKHWLFGL